MATEPLSALRHGLGLAGPRGAAAGLRGGRAGGGPVGALLVAVAVFFSPWEDPAGQPGPWGPPLRWGGWEGQALSPPRSSRAVLFP